MKKIISILAIVFLLNDPYASAKYGAGQAIGRIGTLGDSLTYGTGDYTGRVQFAYRDHLQDALGVGLYDFVGNLYWPGDTDGIYDNRHDGVPGEESEDIEARVSATLTANFPLPNPPNSWIIIKAGTNDIRTAGTAASNSTRDNVEDMIELIEAHDASLNILVLTIDPHTTGGTDSNFESYNTTLMVMLATKRGLNPKVNYADSHEYLEANCSPLTDCMYLDGLHLNDTGYDRQADIIATCMGNPSAPYCNGN